MDFNKEIEVVDKLVLLDFFATWCGPCQATKEHVEELEREYADKVKVIKIDIDEYPAIASKYRILSVPTFIVLKDKEIIKRESGARDKEELLELLGL